MAESGDALLTLLAKTPFGRGLSPGDLAKVADIASVEQAESSTLLFQEGSACDYLYIVTSGLVGLDMCMPRRGCMRILTVGEGDFVGWSPLVGDGRMTTRATVVESVTLIKFEGDRLRALCEADHDIGYSVMTQVAVGLSRRLLATRLQMLDVFGETQPVPPPGPVVTGPEDSSQDA